MEGLARRIRALLRVLACACALGAPLAAAEKESAGAAPAAEASVPARAEARGLGEPGALEALAIGPETAAPLRGADARRQLVITGRHASGQERDLTHNLSYSVSPGGIVSVEGGYVTPLGDGEALVTAHAKDPETGREISSSVSITVVQYHDQPLVNFPNQVVPVFTKHGCNGGGCHGKSGGQNGFRLGLLGFYPEDDHEYLVHEGRGRRVFPAAPDASLLLLKASGTVPHGGGKRVGRESYEYRILHRWMRQGMPYGNEKDLQVERISVFPDVRTMDRRTRQQLAVVAHYNDGSSEDVTRMATYEANDTEMAEVSPAGLVETLDLTGDVAVMVRYQAQVGVFRASIPLGAEVKSLPPARNFIDELVFAKLENLGMPPSDVCDDATFLRRVTVDLAGRLPTAEEAEAFATDADPAKRDRVIERLLAHADHSEYFTNKWAALLRNKKEKDTHAYGTYAFHDWLRESLHENRPYDEIVRDVLAASGDVRHNPAVVWYRSVNETNQQVEDSAQLFLGLRIQCARCHHHPFEKWSQRDYYGYAAFFSRVGRKDSPDGFPDEQRVIHNRGKASARHPRTGETLSPAGLGAAPLELSADEDPRHALVDWMRDPGNPFFAPALVNRYWKHFFGRGLVDPEDDMRQTNPPANPDLLDALARHFVASGFDLKDLARTICRSTVYQLSAIPNEHNLGDKQNFSRFYPRRLHAEVLYDALNQVTRSKAGFGGLPAELGAVELPDSGLRNYFLTVFGKPMADSACECERSGDANLAQSLHLLNSKEVLGKISSDSGRAAEFARDEKRSSEEKLRELYLWVYARPPSPEELEVALAHLGGKEKPREGWEDIVWALVNTKEFLFNH